MKYRIFASVTHTEVVMVHAYSEEEAEEKAKDVIYDRLENLSDIEVYDIKEITEEK